MSLPVQPGQVLEDKYVVEDVIGEGGMGVVLTAQHLGLGQRVALKFMLTEESKNEAQVARFLREARASAGLKSVHSARVLGTGRLETGVPYIVMEYLKGENLDEVSSRGPLDVAVAVDYVLQACEALAEAHGMGIVHRDIKLKNLFRVRGPADEPVIKVLDFGLAKTVDAELDTSLTSTSTVFGSPQYMSPEQMRSAKTVDARTDIWGLGVCLYELLTAHMPFDGETLPELCAQVLKDAPGPMSAYVSSVPAGLEAVVMKCLEKDRTKRFESVAALAAALEPFTNVSGAAARVATSLTDAQKVDLTTTETLTAPFPPVGASADENPPSGVWTGDSGRLRTKRRAQIAFALLAVAAVAGGVVATLRHHSASAIPPAPATTAPASNEPAAPSATEPAPPLASSTPVVVASTPRPTRPTTPPKAAPRHAPAASPVTTPSAAPATTPAAPDPLALPRHPLPH